MADKLNNAYSVDGMIALTNIMDSISDYRKEEIEKGLAHLLNNIIKTLTPEERHAVVEYGGSKKPLEEEEAYFLKEIQEITAKLEQKQLDHEESAVKFDGYPTKAIMIADSQARIRKEIDMLKACLANHQAELQQKRYRNLHPVFAF